MNLLSPFSGNEWLALAAALLHTLWQGAVVAVFLTVMLRWSRSPTRRYAAAVAALVLVLLAGMSTWAVLGYQTPVDSTASSEFSPNASLSAAPAADPEVEPVRTASDRRGPSAFAPRDWRPLLAAFWLTGVVGMLFRMFLLLRDAERLRARCRPAEDSMVDRVLAGLCKRLGLQRSVRVLVADGIVSPLAMGILWPVVVFPAAMITGINPDLMRAVLAHELAHIRRHDYLVNLGQMLVETVLFFNPAVWWISRQIRIEREACCDQLASRMVGGELSYAQALTDFAASARKDDALPLLAHAFGDRRGPGSLLERIRRLLIPDYRPRVCLPWLRLGAFVVMGAVILFGLQQGTRLAVVAGAEWLSYQERMSQIRELQDTHGHLPPDFGQMREDAGDPKGKVHLTGTVEFNDGTGADTHRIRGSANSRRVGYSAGYGFRVSDGEFAVDVAPGNVTIQATSDGYAPVFAGPFELEPGESKAVKLVFTRGYTSRIRFVDPNGHPLSGVRVSGSYEQPMQVLIQETESDEAGLATLTNCAAMAVKLEANLSGYQQDSIIRELPSEGVLSWKLYPAVPTTVIIVSEATGEGIPNVRAGLVRVEGVETASHDPNYAPVFAVSDKQGLLRLDRMRDDSVYWFILEAEGFGRRFLGPVMPGEDQRVVRLGPPLLVRGVVRGDLGQLRSGSDNTDAFQARIGYCNPLDLDGNESSHWKSAFLTVSNGRGSFEITNLWPGEIEIAAGHERISRTLTEPLTNLVIELPSADIGSSVASERTVVFKLEPPPGYPPPEGRFRMLHLREERRNTFHTEAHWLDLTNGMGRMTVPADGKIGYETAGLVGYWIEERTMRADLAPGEEPLVLTIPCYPAGAIHGSVREADGSPARAVLIGVVESERASNRPDRGLGVDVKNSASPNDRTERFVASPLPLGGAYAIVAHRGANYVVSEELGLSDKNPIRETQLTMAKGQSVTGMVHTVSGKPLAAYTLFLEFVPHAGHSYRGQSFRTDRFGRFVIEEVNARARGDYYVLSGENQGYRPFRQRLDVLDGQVDITVEVDPGGN